MRKFSDSISVTNQRKTFFTIESKSLHNKNIFDHKSCERWGSKNFEKFYSAERITKPHKIGEKPHTNKILVD